MRRDDEGNAGNPFTLVADTRSTRFRSLRFPGRTSGEAFLGGDVAIWGSEWVSDWPFYVKNDEYLDLRSKMKIWPETWCMAFKIYFAKDLSHDDDGDGDGDDDDDQDLK